MEMYIDMLWEGLAALSMIIAGATIIAKYTKTKKDDEILGKINKYVEAIADLKKPTK